MNERAALALTAIPTCNSPNKPTEIIALEGEKYFGKTAMDGEEGTEADRLFRHIWRSKHTSTLEHISYTFAIEGLSRAALAQLTRHRQLSFSVQSQRYVRFGSDDKTGGFDYVTPPSVENNNKELEYVPEDCDDCVASTTAVEIYKEFMALAQRTYDTLRDAGVPAEDARMVLPQAATCNLVMSGNLRAILEFYSKRKSGRGAQWEITEMAEKMRNEITKVDPWTERFFNEV